MLADALAMGHEGVIVKSLDAPYAAGRRGAGWLKVKPVHTLDLVDPRRRVGPRPPPRLALQPPPRRAPRHGARAVRDARQDVQGADRRDARRGRPSALLELATERGDWVVHVRPELVVEIAFDGVQTQHRATRAAWRCASPACVRHRPDKRAEEADTLASVLAVRAG